MPPSSYIHPSSPPSQEELIGTQKADIWDPFPLMEKPFLWGIHLERFEGGAGWGEGSSLWVESTEANCVPESSQQRPCLYDAEWSGFPSLKEGQWDRGRQFGRPTERAASTHSYGG
ncbi:hypothetical protein CRENBAI_006368 [Crenichthys baileyi]|uniref:Uncharacterized protein n=1 Tax=Crenichthys baileyi TaxID=28760 RepID=A0AAV9S807_9TELE